MSIEFMNKISKRKNLMDDFKRSNNRQYPFLKLEHVR